MIISSAMNFYIFNIRINLHRLNHARYILEALGGHRLGYS